MQSLQASFLGRPCCPLTSLFPGLVLLASCLHQRWPDREETQLTEGCVRAVTASVLTISMAPRQGDNLIRLFSASWREGVWRETGRRGLAFPHCLSLPLSLSKFLLIKWSGAKEAAHFHDLCWDLRQLSGNALGLANSIRDPRAGGLPRAQC